MTQKANGKQGKIVLRSFFYLSALFSGRSRISCIFCAHRFFLRTIPDGGRRAGANRARTKIVLERRRKCSRQSPSRLRDGARLGVAAAALISATEALAAPWTRSPAGVFIETRADYFRAADGAFQRLESVNYVELGLPWKLMVGGKVAYGRTWTDNAPAVDGLSEVEIFLQRTIFRAADDKQTLSVRFAGARPARFEAGARDGLASDGYDAEARALYGRNITAPPFKTFLIAEAAFRKRTGVAADQVRLDAALGLEPSARFFALIEAQAKLSLRNEAIGPFGPGPDFDVIRIQPSIIWRATPRVALRVGGAVETAARNLTTGRSAFIGLWTEF